MQQLEQQQFTFMYIKELEIKNIRSIREFKMLFDKPAGWHVLIGDNGAGKSSVVRSIAAVLIGPEQIAGILPVWQEWLNDESLTGKIELKILPDWAFDSIGRGQPPNKDKTIINRFDLERISNKRAVVLSTNASDNKLPPTNYNWGNNNGWFSVAYGPFRRFTGGEEKRNKIFYAYPKAGAHLSVFGEEIALTEALDWLKDLDRKRLKQIEQNNQNSLKEANINYNNEAELIFQSVQSFINSSGLLPHHAIFDSIDIDGEVIFKDGNGSIVKVTQMSDGYRSILSLMFELLRQLINTYSIEKVFQIDANDSSKTIVVVPGIVLIDEIDAHLHPTWQTRIGEWFTRFFPNIQFIVSTHSPLVCRGCENGSIWRLASPGSPLPSKEITGIDKNRLIFGNVLDAYGTDIFGKSITISKEGNEKRNRLGELNIKSILGEMEEGDQKELQDLKAIFPTEKTPLK